MGFTQIGTVLIDFDYKGSKETYFADLKKNDSAIMYDVLDAVEEEVQKTIDIYNK